MELVVEVIAVAVAVGRRLDCSILFYGGIFLD